MKKTSLIFLVIFVFLSLFGCRESEKSENYDKITFTDALGREVSVEKSPERVAALLGSFADVWHLAGGNITATSDDAWEDFDLPLDSAVNVGGAHSPNLEKLLESAPDFVIASASTASNVELLPFLENAGIAVAYFDVDNFDSYLKMLDVCTDITGRKDFYKQNGTQIKEKIDELKKSLTPESFPEEKRSVLLLRTSSTGVKAKGSHGTILGEMLSELGCVNIADSDKALLENLSLESIIKADPYHIFVVTMGSDTEKALTSLKVAITENPAWESLTAVRENRLHLMDKKLFNIKPNARWARSYEKLCEILLEL